MTLRELVALSGAHTAGFTEATFTPTSPKQALSTNPDLFNTGEAVGSRPMAVLVVVALCFAAAQRRWQAACREQACCPRQPHGGQQSSSSGGSRGGTLQGVLPVVPRALPDR